MNIVTLGIQADCGGWTWTVVRGADELAAGSASCADEAIRSGRAALQAILDTGLEREICRPYWARSWLCGTRL